MMNQHPPSFGMQMFHEILKIWVPNMEQHYTTKKTWEIPSNEATQRRAKPPGPPPGPPWMPALPNLGSTDLEFQSGERPGCFRKIVSVFPPQIIHFNRVFHYFHHPFWGIPIFGNTQILRKVGQQRACVQVAGRSFSSCLSRAALRKLR